MSILNPYVDKIPGSTRTNTRLRYISNLDGTPRWIWPDGLAKPLFLRFYNTAGWKSGLYATIIRVIFLFRLQRFVFPFSEGSVPSDMGRHWAMFTGTNGLTRKLVIYNNGCFVKVPFGELAASTLQNEAHALDSLGKTGTAVFDVPAGQSTGDGSFIQTAGNGKNRITHFTPTHQSTIEEIFRLHSVQLPFLQTKTASEAGNHLRILAESSKMPHGLCRKLSLLHGAFSRDEIIVTGTVHGDFTPWNMLFDDHGRPFVYDWEAFASGMPFGFDAFHFIMQQSILVDKKPWNEIHTEMIQRLTGVGRLFADSGQMHKYLSLYLLQHVTAAMAQYIALERWHPQIYWMTDTWNAALDMLCSNILSDRQNFILSLTDHLKGKNYAGLKLPATSPELWPETSDIDIVTDRKVTTEVIKFVNRHTKVAKVKTIKKSHMTSLVVWLENSQMISLDMIYQLKRRDLHFMNAGSMISGAVTGNFGISHVNPADSARYVAWFYGLNGTVVPEKYRHMAANLVSQSDNSDSLLGSWYHGDSAAAEKMKSLLTTHTENQGIKRIISFAKYGVDTIKDMMRFDGMMITFSGVDGAGKSTIIHEITEKITKNLRKEVVVIRHRPSVLPIISALRHGREKAEQISVSKLPRTGTNKSTLSSLVRFGYYYADYLFGQFYIYLKYVSRGKVVLYDRYYFDFINDSKRSNIVLPSWLVKAGYTFLIKPYLNYFLYADPEVILSRKQELDANTIVSLTEKYKTLFNELSEKHAGSRYISVNNVVREETISILLQDITTILTAA